MSPPTIEAAVLQLQAAVASALGLLGPVSEIVLRFESGREVPLPVPGGGGPAATLTPTEAAIVAAMRGRPPAKSSVVAVRAGRVADAHFRRTFKQLQRRGLIEPDPADPHHYRLCAGA